MIIFLVSVLVFTSGYCHSSYVGGYDYQESPDEITYSNNAEKEPLEQPTPSDSNEKLELNRLSDFLVSILREDWGNDGLPLLYVEEEPIVNGAMPELTSRPWKRTRYYRRYPWKRQNSRTRTRYEPDNPYMCQPSRDDVFKLLVALHETRAGNGGRSINFCNRRRSAGAIFTNIRFLGRRK